MFKSIILVLVVFHFPQENRDSINFQNGFNKIIDYINYESVLWSLDKYKSEDPKPYNKFVDNFKGETPSFYELENFLKDYKIAGTSALCKEINSIKVDNPGALAGKEVLVRFLTTDIFKSEKLNNLKLFAEKRKGPAFDAYIEKIRDKISEIFPDSENEILTDENYSSNNPPIIGAHTKSVKGTLSMFIVVLVIFLVLLQSGIIIFLRHIYYRIERLENKIQDKTANSKIYEAKELVREDRFSTKSLEDKIIRLGEKISLIEDRISKNSKSEKPEINTNTVIFSGIPVEKDMEEATRTLYFPAPNSDGTFNDSDKLEYFKDSESIYKFSILEKDIAEFSLVENSDTISIVLRLPDAYIKPVCDSENVYSQSAKKILVLRPGKAIKEGNKWSVLPEHKLMIRYV